MANLENAESLEEVLSVIEDKLGDNFDVEIDTDEETGDRYVCIYEADEAGDELDEEEITPDMEVKVRTRTLDDEEEI